MSDVVITKENVGKMSTYICCPWCDLKKCERGSDRCDAKRWAEQKRKELEEE